MSHDVMPNTLVDPAARGAAGSFWPRAAEFALIFIGIPLLLASGWMRVPVIPLLLGVAGVTLAVLLSDRGFDRSRLWNFAGLRRSIPSILAIFAGATIIIAIAVALVAPHRLLAFPREHALLWALVMLAYPILSVYPQELIFRAFVFHRYRELFRSRPAMILASAMAFAFAHIVFDGWVAVALTFPGGILFAWRYQQTRSLLAASVEHALYGQLMFTIGLGEFFYRGSLG